jgi:hypothetical protein
VDWNGVGGGVRVVEFIINIVLLLSILSLENEVLGV